jgi:hypothetical protein
MSVGVPSASDIADDFYITFDLEDRDRGDHVLIRLSGSELARIVIEVLTNPRAGKVRDDLFEALFGRHRDSAPK